ncbi:hypothetical protein OAB57_03120 [Bacteriovoracaceae bacterium]|nr:hypothetical protein [Bacteriovoracaceae bacterium]
MKFIIYFLAILFLSNNGIAFDSNLASQYRKTYRKIRSINYSIDQEQLKKYKIFIITGFSNKLIPQILDVMRIPAPWLPKDSGDSFLQQKRFFDKAGIDYIDVPINTLEGCDDNAKIIAHELEKTNKKVIFLSYSKGGLDVLETLVKYPQLHNKIAGWISMHTPFYGTPLIDTVLSTPPLNYLFKFLVNRPIFNGNSKVFSCMSRKARIQYYSDNDIAIDTIRKKIPSLLVGGWKTSWSSKEKKSILAPIIVIIDKVFQFGKNDGFIPTSSMCLAKFNCFSLSNMDHASPVMDVPAFYSITESRRINYTRSLIKMLIKNLTSNSLVR